MRPVVFALVAVLMLLGAGAVVNAQTTDANAGNTLTIGGAIQAPDIVASIDTVETKTVAVAENTTTSSDTPADPSSENDESRIFISLNYYGYIPTDSTTRDIFGDIWHSFFISRFRPDRPNKWVFDWDATLWWRNADSNLLIIPVSVGVQRGFSEDPNRQPYLALRVGGYWGRVTDNLQGPDDSKFGADANVALGLVIDQKYVVEARYDWYSKLAGNDLNGFTIMAGVKIFSFKL